MSPLPPPTRPHAFRTDAIARRDTLAKARIVDWSALETRLIRIGDGSMGRQQKCGEGDEQHIRAWLICDAKQDFDSIADPPHIPSAQWMVATPGHGENAFPRDVNSLLVSFDASWPNGECLFNEPGSRSFSAQAYPQMEAAALALVCYVRKHLPDNGTILPDSVADLHVYLGLKHRLDGWLEAFFSAMTAEGAVPTRLGIGDERIQRALRLLDSWPLEEPLDRERLAREAGVTVAHLDRLFTAQLHITPSRYFDGRRIDRACRSLSKSEITIKAVASGLGFHSEAHFSHWFRQHRHACPRSFRQDHTGSTREGS